MTIQAEVQKSEVEAPIELFVLDATALGDQVYRMTPNSQSPGPVMWGGDEYAPIACQGVGWGMDSSGQLPTPKFRMANEGVAITSAIYGFDDLRGATLTRFETFRRFLDDGAEPSTDDCFPPDVFTLNRKSRLDFEMIEWELASAFDQLSLYLPRRQILKSACTHVYRKANPDGSFSYDRATCPYTDATYFTRAGVPTLDPTQDNCGRKLSDCKIRWGLRPLPTRAFPAAAEASA